MASKLSDRLRSRFPIICKMRGHDFRLELKKAESPDVTVEEEICPCGARLVRRLVVRHGVCPHCGGSVVYDGNRPKTYVGTDVYCEEAYGEWYCERCRQTGDEDFSGDFTEVTSHIV